jgi:hypothetical protein
MRSTPQLAVPEPQYWPVLPEFGQNGTSWLPSRLEVSVNDAELDDLNELVEYLARTSRLEPQEARRVVDEVLSFLVEEPEPFVRRRHLALQRQGLANPAIFARLQAELAQRRFPAPAYTTRQLRRIIYG